MNSLQRLKGFICVIQYSCPYSHVATDTWKLTSVTEEWDFFILFKMN